MASSFKVDRAVLNSLTPAQQRDAREWLKAATDGFKKNPLLTHVPYDKQWQFHRAKERTRMFVGGNRTGKSTAGAIDDLVQALPAELVPEQFQEFKKFGWEEPFKGRIITPDLGFTMDVILEKFRQLTPRDGLVNDSWEGAFDKAHRILRFKNGSRIDFMSFEQDPDKFGGVDLHRVHYDEEPSGPNAKKIYRDSRVRLIDHGGDQVFTMTPLFGVTWVNDDLWARRHERDDVFGIQVSMSDNPYISKKEIKEALADLTKEERAAIEHGNFTHFEGSFYPEFNETLHVVKPPSPSDLKGQDILVGIDPGLKKTAAIWVGFDNDNAAIAFDELYLSDHVIPQVCQQIKEVNERWGCKPRYIIDPSARNRATVNAEQIEAEYAREGIYCEHGQNARGPGILEVKRRLQKGMLVVSRECRNLRMEFPRYRKDEATQDEFMAIKQDDHLLDALRYVVMAKTWVLPKQHRIRTNTWVEDPTHVSSREDRIPLPDPLGDYA